MSGNMPWRVLGGSLWRPGHFIFGKILAMCQTATRPGPMVVVENDEQKNSRN